MREHSQAPEIAKGYADGSEVIPTTKVREHAKVWSKVREHAVTVKSLTRRDSRVREHAQVAGVRDFGAGRSGARARTNDLTKTAEEACERLYDRPGRHEHRGLWATGQ